jgi:hypothetical protein
VRDVLDGIDYDIVIPNGNTTGVRAIKGGHPLHLVLVEQIAMHIK